MFEPFQCLLVESTSFVADHWENALFCCFLSTFVFTITFSRWFFTAEAHVKVIHHLAVVYVVEIILSIDLVAAGQSLV